MKRLFILFSLILLGLVLASCQSEADKQISAIKDNTSWVIANGKVWVSRYKVGLEVTGDIVLHNGNDRQRTISLEYSGILSSQKDAKTGYSYEWFDASKFVTISQPEITLQPMENKAVNIKLQVPKGVVLPKRWEFDIVVSDDSGGQIVWQGKQRWLVTSGGLLWTTIQSDGVLSVQIN